VQSFQVMQFKYRPLVAAMLLGMAAQSQAQEQQAMEAVVISASRSNMDVDKAPQTVVVITREEIERQLTMSSNSSDVLSSILPSYTPSRGKMNGSGETLRGRTALILIDGVPQSNPVRPTGREAHTIDYSRPERHQWPGRDRRHDQHRHAASGKRVDEPAYRRANDCADDRRRG
jgi:iron complex outermembrane recepter protein